ncbi:2-oxoacid:ferredoxin oxidoreductase subunit beta [Sesbania bispinosa]|nr:2-oxoacid:ferredoxin oxidoreductase subunit beta [Sesbania bispinosa]
MGMGRVYDLDSNMKPSTAQPKLLKGMRKGERLCSPNIYREERMMKGKGKME